jgi:hypothetical protein
MSMFLWLPFLPGLTRIAARGVPRRYLRHGDQRVVAKVEESLSPWPSQLTKNQHQKNNKA